jgi:chromosome partitioning protein
LTKVIAVCNQKGGVGKTTTSINTAAGIAVLEKKALLIDLDPQSNASQGLGFISNFENDIYTALTWQNRETIHDHIGKIIRKTELKYLDFIPCSQNLAGFEFEFSTIEGKENQLAQILEHVKNDYDYIFLDGPPSLGLLTINILSAADSVIIPIQCEYYALTGLADLIKIIRLVQKNLNKNLAIEGALLTMYDSRLNLAKQVVDDVRSNFSGKVFNTIIPRTVRLSEAPSFGKPVILYDIISMGAIKYLEFARELLNHD